ncbi:MAG: radical SAM protein [Promethearchaeota archaeon]
MNIPLKFQRLYTRSNYRIVGKYKHSALKPCHYMIESLYTGRNNRRCYKSYFGIKSEQCIQCTPALPYCTHNCVFCWRELEEGNLGPKFNTTPDEPSYLVEEFIRNQINLLDHHFPLNTFIQNYEIMENILEFIVKNKSTAVINELNKILPFSKNKIERAILVLKNVGVISTLDNIKYYLSIKDDNQDVSNILKTHVTTKKEIIDTHARAHSPSHAAISLAGEPTLYPYISELVDEFRKRRFTTFIVSNGTQPETVSKMKHLPTQFYFTLPHPDKKKYLKIHRPSISNGYERIKQTLDLVPSLSCRTCLRITLVKKVNDLSDLSVVKGYVKMIEKANPNFVDIKGFSVEARAMMIKKRLGLGGQGVSISEGAAYVPTFDDALNFAKELSDMGGFPIVETSRTARNILLLVNWPRNKRWTIEKL